VARRLDALLIHGGTFRTVLIERKRSTYVETIATTLKRKGHYYRGAMKGSGRFATSGRPADFRGPRFRKAFPGSCSNLLRLTRGADRDPGQRFAGHDTLSFLSLGVRPMDGGRESNPYCTKSFCMRGVIRKSENCSATARTEARQVYTTACPN
jgi:hypothetical protein